MANFEKGQNLNNFRTEPTDDIVYKISTLWAFYFHTRGVFKFAFLKLLFFSSPVTSLCKTIGTI
jgi:hypothetical protein